MFKKILFLTFCFIVPSISNNFDIREHKKIGMLIIDRPCNSWEILRPLMKFFLDKNIKAIVIMVQLGYGYFDYAQAFAIAKSIISLKKLYPKPIISYGETALTNSEYVIAAAADWIMCSKSCLLGNIGTNSNYISYKDKNEKDGYFLTPIYAGKYKILRNSNLVISKSDILILQEIINNKFKIIVNNLIELRPALEKYKNNWIEGEIFLPEEETNKENFFVDFVGDKLDLKKLVYEKIYNKKMNIEEVERNEIELIIEYPKKKLENMVLDNRITNTIAILQAQDYLKSQDSTYYLKILLDIFKDTTIEGIVLNIDVFGADSGGLMTNLFYEIKKLKKIYKKPVVAYVTKAFSGGYALACAADYIMGCPVAEVGSVGVIVERWHLSTKDLKYYTISSNKLIDTFNQNINLTDSQKIMMQNVVNKEHKIFIERVLESRPQLAQNESEWKEAQTYLAPQALQLGLIDAIGTPLDAINLINKKIKFENTYFIFYDFTLQKCCCENNLKN